MIRRRVVLAPAASHDISDILEYLLVSAGADIALATNDRLDASLESLRSLADRGRAVPELRARGVTTYREIMASPYRILYRVKRREVWVVAVVDHHRDVDALLHARARRDRSR